MSLYRRLTHFAFAPTIARAAPVQSFSYSPTSPFTGELITFTSPYDNPQDWDLNGDGTCDDASGTTAQHSFEAAGTYTVKLCVGGPNPANFTRTVTVQNRPPIADFSYDLATASTKVGISWYLKSTRRTTLHILTLHYGDRIHI